MANKIIKNASIVMIFSLFAKFSSFFVELLIASCMGANEETDAFYMVYGIVQIVYPMISVGIWKVFLPEYKTRTVLHKDVEAREITSKLLSVFSFISAIIIVVFYCFPGAVIKVFAPGFGIATFSISKTLLRIVVFILLFNTISTFASAILQSNERFTKSQVKEIVFHLPTLFYLVVFREKCNIQYLAFSIVAGSVLASVFSYIFVRKYYRYCFPKLLIDKDVVSVLKQVPVACLNSIINQLNNVIDKIYASTLPTGSVTYLNYGSKLISLFDGIFSTAISTALFPYITELVAKKEYGRLRQFLKNYIVLISMILLPFSALILVYANEIVQIVFGHGKFDTNSVNITATVLFMYGLGLLFMCLTTIINDIFYILKRTRILLWTTCVNIFSNIILDYIFVKLWGVSGLALATTISLLFALIIKLLYIQDIIALDKVIVKHLLSIVLYCCISSILPFYINQRMDLNTVLRLALGCIVFTVVYLTLALVLNIEMRKMFMSSIRRLSRGRANSDEKSQRGY